MKNHQNPCTEDALQKALFEKRVMDISDCLLACFKKFKHKVFPATISEFLKDEVFWAALKALDRKSIRGSIELTTSVCKYFKGFVNQLWRAYKTNQGKKEWDFEELEDYDEPDFRDALVMLLEKEKVDAVNDCISKLDKKCQILLRGFSEGKKDAEIMEELGFTNVKGVSVARKRCFEKLKKCLQNNYPELFKN